VRGYGRLIRSGEIEGSLGHRVRKEGTSCQVQRVVGRNSLTWHCHAQLGPSELVGLFYVFFFFVFNMGSLRALRGEQFLPSSPHIKLLNKNRKPSSSHSKSSHYYLSSLLIVLSTQVPFEHFYLSTVCFQRSISLIVLEPTARGPNSTAFSFEL
jgi:hypothetical protein